MFSSIWHGFIYDPLYNTLVAIIDIMPGHSAGLAIILLTILVKVILFPLTAKSSRAQRAMKELEPELRQLREKFKEDKARLAKETMTLYQTRGVTPFSGCLPLLIQMPIIIGLYFVFSQGLKTVDTALLYSFVTAPESFDLHFLIFDLAGKSLILAMMAGFFQYIQTSLSLGKQAPLPPKKEGQAPSFQDDFARSMQVQMRYVLPVMVSFIAYTTPAAVALYWTTSNILGILQELFLQKNNKKQNTPLS